jgi:hypothetical protein
MGHGSKASLTSLQADADNATLLEVFLPFVLSFKGK